MIPLLLVGAMISATAFIAFTGVAIMLGVGLLVYGLPNLYMVLVGIALLGGWLISCRGVVVGMQAVFNPDAKALGIAAVYGLLAGAEMTALLGGFGDVW
ncbi:hypothetical protein [Sphingobium naphthae]|uniref:hypothetical protein n=1 Tax=Sphingobium naphthae TaxID=1886786 RepID=UPI003749E25D